MKSPPADIFIYGVHLETSEEDISNDLKESDIIVDVKDIVKKSKPEAGLNSFKISVKAEDLKKALNPEIWPMRVKVREYIYYSKKPQNSRGGQPTGPGGPHGRGAQAGQGEQAGQQGQGGQREQDGQAGGRGQGGYNGQQSGPGVGQPGAGEWNGIPTHSRFDVLNADVIDVQP